MKHYDKLRSQVISALSEIPTHGRFDEERPTAIDVLGAIQYAIEYRTLIFCTPRRVGKTHLIRELSRPGDIVVTPRIRDVPPEHKKMGVIYTTPGCVEGGNFFRGMRYTFDEPVVWFDEVQPGDIVHFQKELLPQFLLTIANPDPNSVIENLRFCGLCTNWR